MLRNACDTGDDLIAKEALRSVVPTFKTPEEENKEIAERNVTITKNNIEQEGIDHV